MDAKNAAESNPQRTSAAEKQLEVASDPSRQIHINLHFCTRTNQRNFDTKKHTLFECATTSVIEFTKGSLKRHD